MWLILTISLLLLHSMSTKAGKVLFTIMISHEQGAILRDIQGACYICIQGCQKEFPGCGKTLTGSMQVCKKQTRPMRRDEKLFMRNMGTKVIFGRGQQIQEKDWTKAHRPFVSPAWWPWLCGGMADGGGGAHTPTKPPQKWSPQVSSPSHLQHHYLNPHGPFAE